VVYGTEAVTVETPTETSSTRTVVVMTVSLAVSGRHVLALEEHVRIGAEGVAYFLLSP
jgi:uncharacterized membrane protein